jgi:hypothetical protein
MTEQRRQKEGREAIYKSVMAIALKERGERGENG